MRAALVLASVLLGQQAARAQRDNAENVKRLKTWRLADKVSQSTIGAALGADKDLLAKLRKDAAELARELDVRFAEFPEWKGAPKDDIPLAVAYLLNEAAGKGSAQLAAKHGHEYRAIFDLAVMTNLALLLYSPDAESCRRRASACSWSRAGRAATVPEVLWKYAAAKIRAREAGAAVEKELKASREAIGRYLEQQAGMVKPDQDGAAADQGAAGRGPRPSCAVKPGRTLSAAAIANRAGKQDLVEVVMKEANRLAKELDVELPELPGAPERRRQGRPGRDDIPRQDRRRSAPQTGDA